MGCEYRIELKREQGTGNREQGADLNFPIPDSRFPIPDSRFPIPDSLPIISGSDLENQISAG
ncbi:hypothetical protein [Moorena sp. SIO3I6]|uniref:hypothetical protein n=1 Tax=Moorena sp. SIO3I6 TaxID=2607831 RepID=UPI0013FC6E6C|nr:hypothetical protein [Moorena sp. SIO3I6]NEP24723.1 hypothetical protein [Moorena sp. SIO3I6]